MHPFKGVCRIVVWRCSVVQMPPLVGILTEIQYAAVAGLRADCIGAIVDGLGNVEGKFSFVPKAINDEQPDVLVCCLGFLARVFIAMKCNAVTVTAAVFDVARC